MTDKGVLEKEVEKKRKYGRKYYMEEWYRPTVNINKLKSMESSLKKTLSSLHNEMDRLDLEWLQLCNLLLGPKIDLSNFKLNLSNYERQIIDDEDIINSVEIDIRLNLSKQLKMSKTNEPEEEKDSEEET